jgi:hypothetical protein
MASTGIGKGIGEGLSKVAENIRRRDEFQYLADQERDKRAHEVLQRGTDMTDNLVQLGYGIKHDPNTNQPILVNAAGQPDPNAPDNVKNIFDQVLKTNKEFQSMYPPDQGNAMWQTFRKFLGRPPKTPVPDPRATRETPEAWAASAKIKPEQYTGDVAEVRQLAKLIADPQTPPEDKESYRKLLAIKLTPKAAAQDTWRPTGDPKFDNTTQTWYQSYVDSRDPSKTRASPLPKSYQPPGTLKQANDQQIESEAIQLRDNGVQPPPADKRRVEDLMTRNGWTPYKKPTVDNSPEGRTAKIIFDAGEAVSMQDAYKQAATMLLNKAKAQQKLAAGQNLTPEDAATLAYSDFIAGTTTNFGIGASADKALYNKMRAQLLSGGNFASLLNMRIGVKASAAELTNLKKNFGGLQVNEGNARKNFDLIKSLGQAVDQTTARSGIPALQTWIQTGQLGTTQSPELRNYLSAITEALTEYAKVVTGQTSGAAVTVAANKQAQDLIGKNLDPATVNSWIDTVATPMINNRKSSYLDTISGIQDELGGAGGGGKTGEVEELEFGPDGNLRKKEKK